MSRLEEIKNEVAKEYNFQDWETMVLETATRKGSSIGKITEIECRYDTVTERYAEACSKASLEKASKIAKTYKNGNSGSYLDASIDRKSITQESNIVML